VQGQQTDCGSHRDAEGTDGQSVVEVTRETMPGFHHEGHEEHEEWNSMSRQMRQFPVQCHQTQERIKRFFL